MNKHTISESALSEYEELLRKRLLHLIHFEGYSEENAILQAIEEGYDRDLAEEVLRAQVEEYRYTFLQQIWNGLKGISDSYGIIWAIKLVLVIAGVLWMTIQVLIDLLGGMVVR
ncbi:hypothetical protein [Pontibacter sp. G13]|uniref:hypothetical protein n=1 Tax=Pontibacter sp. G13 TaxID=3074898 RepID=UPI00288BDF47|nr:hypothetical protein [Pontibacter sp. G13]WNJ19952.1 hypothetical protein RJD25_05670 [Pontibacter sp. G13]